MSVAEIPPPPADDARFTTGLWIDVRQVLIDHGYPEASGVECVEIQQALYRLLYRCTTLGTRAAGVEAAKR